MIAHCQCSNLLRQTTIEQFENKPCWASFAKTLIRSASLYRIEGSYKWAPNLRGGAIEFRTSSMRLPLRQYESGQRDSASSFFFYASVGEADLRC